MCSTQQARLGHNIDLDTSSPAILGLQILLHLHNRPLRGRVRHSEADRETTKRHRRTNSTTQTIHVLRDLRGPEAGAAARCIEGDADGTSAVVRFHVPCVGCGGACFECADDWSGCEVGTALAGVGGDALVLEWTCTADVALRSAMCADACCDGKERNECSELHVVN